MSQNNKALFLALSCALSAGLFSCGGSHYVDYAYGYGTNWTIHLYEGKQSDVDDIIALINRTSRLLDPESHVAGGLGKLNEEGQVEADPFLKEAIALGQKVESLSQGAYSIRIGKLSNAWKSSLAKGQVVPESEVATLTQQAKETTLAIEGNIIIKTGSGEVELSSLGKGLCLDHIKTLLEEKGIKKYFIDAGSSSLLFGENSSSSGETKVRLKDAPSHSFQAKNCAVSCSSISEQNWVIDGVKYSHIIDARTGSAKANDDALYLRGQGAGELDALSTAYMVLGKERVGELESKSIDVAFIQNKEVAYASASFLS